jgi:hypothetical protein
VFGTAGVVCGGGLRHCAEGAWLISVCCILSLCAFGCCFLSLPVAS